MAPKPATCSGRGRVRDRRHHHRVGARPQGEHSTPIPSASRSSARAALTRPGVTTQLVGRSDRRPGDRRRDRDEARPRRDRPRREGRRPDDGPRHRTRLAVEEPTDRAMRASRPPDGPGAATGRGRTGSSRSRPRQSAPPGPRLRRAPRRPTGPAGRTSRPGADRAGRPTGRAAGPGRPHRGAQLTLPWFRRRQLRPMRRRRRPARVTVRDAAETHHGRSPKRGADADAAVQPRPRPPPGRHGVVAPRAAARRRAGAARRDPGRSDRPAPGAGEGGG